MLCYSWEIRCFRQKLGERPVTATDSSLEPFKMLLVDWSLGRRLYYVILTVTNWFIGDCDNPHQGYAFSDCYDGKG
jgi:hypothetical protein